MFGELAGKFKMKKAFTIVELLVAVGLLTGLLAASGIIFKSAINTQRAANATAEITRKLRTITDQLTADFEHLLKDGEIFLVWVAKDDNELGRYVRFDRMVFFTTGNFYTYHQRFGDIRGNKARICYMLANNNDGYRAPVQSRDERVLARTQHVYTPSDPAARPDFPDISNTPDSFTAEDDNNSEYDTIEYTQWRDINYSDPCTKADMLTAITDITIGTTNRGGATVDTEDPNSIHMLLAEGVGEFTIQGWYEAQQRWVPQVDPDGDGDLDDTDFILANSDNPSAGLDPCNVPGIWYPYQIHVRGPDPSDPSLPQYSVGDLNESHFNDIPGLGRALKFTFTLYDSRGIFPEGKTFTHIVYLDN